MYGFLQPCFNKLITLINYNKYHKLKQQSRFNFYFPKAIISDPQKKNKKI